MSWSATVPATPNSEFAAAVDAAATSPPDVSPQVTDQVLAAKEAVKAIVASGAVGDPTHSYAAQLDGHANPGHEPTAGWANDCITVSVNQADHSNPFADPAAGFAAQDPTGAQETPAHAAIPEPTSEPEAEAQPTETTEEVVDGGLPGSTL